MKYNGPAVENLVMAIGWSNAEKDVESFPSRPHLPLGHQFRTVLRSTVFAIIMLVLIVGNAGIIAVQTDQHMTRSMNLYRYGIKQDEAAWSALVDICFAIVFSLELIMRVTAEEYMFFTGSDRWWNLMDVTLVGSALVEIIASHSEFNFTYMRLLRVLRAARALRIVRAVKFLKDLRVMLMSVLNSLMSLMWAFLFLFGIIFLFGVIFLQATATFIEAQDATTGDHATVADLELHFANMPQTFASLFMSTTGGVDWGEIYRTLAKVSKMYSTIFIFYVAFMSIGVLNVIVGIFVQGASECAEREKNQALMAEMQQAGTHMFELKEYMQSFDTDNSGTISPEELTMFLEGPQTKAYLKMYEIDEHEAQGLFRLLGCSAHEATIDEFVVGLQILKGGNSIHVASQWYETRQLMAQIANFMQYTRDHFVFIESQLQDLDIIAGEFVEGESGRASMFGGNQAGEDMHEMKEALGKVPFDIQELVDMKRNKKEKEEKEKASL